MNFKEIEINSLDDMSDIAESSFVFKYIDNGHKLESFVSFKEGSKKLVVCFQGAVNRKKVTPPVFHRWSWSELIQSNVLVVNDPMLYRNSDLKIGWYIGGHNFDYIRKYGELIKSFCEARDIELSNIVFYGSSAGGFAAMAISSYIKNGFVIVNNPQTNILRYYKSHVRDLLDVGFEGISIDEAEKKLAVKFDLISRFEKYKYIPRILYLQNINDVFHYKQHFMPFISRLLARGKELGVEVKLYSDKESGHSPIGKAESLMIINEVLEGLDPL